MAATTYRGDPAGRAIAAIRPHPHRGDLIAAGAAVLTVGVATVNARMAPRWDPAILLVLTVLACALVYGMGLLAPLESDAPRAYHSLLLVAGLVLEAVALYRLDQVLGTDHPLSAAGSVTWIALVLAATAALTARRLNSAICTLIAAVLGWIGLLAFVQWVFQPNGAATSRWILLLAIVLLGLAATSARDRRRRHAVALVDAAGLAGLAIGTEYLVGPAVLGLLRTPGTIVAGAHPATGWALVLLVVGFGLLAYGTVDREPGPGYIGFFVLLAFVLTAGPSGDATASLIGWPLLLLLLGGVVVAAGLRPRRPLPPPPDAGAPDAPTTPIRTQRPPGAGEPTQPIAIEPQDR